MRRYIFDIDGTLSNTAHRQHFLEEEPKNWDAFFDACHLDPPHPHIVTMARQLAMAQGNVYVTGRPERLRQKTENWLAEARLLSTITGGKFLFMRPDGDLRADTIIKLELLAEVRAAGIEPIMAFDDRNSVVAMWRAAGIPCAQVAEGDF